MKDAGKSGMLRLGKGSNSEKSMLGAIDEGKLGTNESESEFGGAESRAVHAEERFKRAKIEKLIS